MKRRFQKALTALEGVRAARADHGAGQAEVDFDPARVTREALVEAVKKAGYEAE